MPVTMDDVQRMLGPNPVIDPFVVMTEICRRLPMGGQEVDGLKKDMFIKKVMQDILEQPQVSGLSKWEDRFLHGRFMGKCGDSKKADLKKWMRKSHKPLSIRPDEYGAFFGWLKSFENSPWDIDVVDELHKTLRVSDKNRGLLVDIPFGAAMAYLSKDLRWSDADVFEYWDFKKSQTRELANSAVVESMLPNGYRLHYLQKSTGRGFVDVQRGTLSNKSFVAPDLRGRDVAVVTHVNEHGRQIELATYWGPDAMHKAYSLATDFAGKMAKCSGGKRAAGMSSKAKAGKLGKAFDFLFGKEPLRKDQDVGLMGPIDDSFSRQETTGRDAAAGPLDDEYGDDKAMARYGMDAEGEPSGATVKGREDVIQAPKNTMAENIMGATPYDDAQKSQRSRSVAEMVNVFGAQLLTPTVHDLYDLGKADGNNPVVSGNKMEMPLAPTTVTKAAPQKIPTPANRPWHKDPYKVLR